MNPNQQQCPFQFQRPFLYENNHFLDKHKKGKESLSFADYVKKLNNQSSLTNQNSPRSKMDTMSTIKLPARMRTLPAIQNQPQLDSMKAHFVINEQCKHKSRPSLQPRQLHLIEKQNALLTPRYKSERRIIKNPSIHQEKDDNMKQFYIRCGGENVLEQVVQDFHELTKNYRLINKLDDPQFYQSNFRNFLEFIMGKPVFYNLEILKRKHLGLQISDKEFNLFKSYLIFCFIKYNKGPPQLVFEFGALIEQYRYVIIPREKTFAQIYNQKVEHKGKEMLQSIYYLAHSAYEKIFADTTLSAYFQGIVIEYQAKKLGKIMQHMMGWDYNQDHLTSLLRESHKHMRLTNVHFTLFKQHMVESMREIGITEKQIELVTSRMDGYRSCIINLDSLYDFFQQSNTLLQSIIKKYESLLKHDIRLKQLSQEQIEKHAIYLIRYITHQHLPNLTKSDLILLHKSCQCKQEWVDAFRDNFFIVIRNLNLNNLVLQDYCDLWFQMRYSIVAQKSIGKVIGSDQLYQIQDKISMNLQDNENYSYYFRNSDYQIKHHIKRIIAFIFKSVSVYKSNDLRVIHQSLKVKEHTFNVFVFLIKQVMEQENISEQLIREAEMICMYYKNSICNL